MKETMKDFNSDIEETLEMLEQIIPIIKRKKRNG